MPNREAADTWLYSRLASADPSIKSFGWPGPLPLRLVCDDEDGKYLAKTLRVLSEAEAWVARTSAEAARLRPAPGSSLRGDDVQAFPYALSHAVWDALDHAVDHLTCLQALLRDARVIYRFAPYALVRGALENACAAVWMLEPSRRADRRPADSGSRSTMSATASRPGS
jgi:hypothetical protein